MTALLYRHTELTDFAVALLQRTALEPAMAQTVAEVLVQGDLLGHDTHGLALLAGYLAELESGSMRNSGAPLLLADYPAAITWDGQRLPGPWLVLQAMQLAAQRAAVQGTCSVVIRRSHHIACLAAYLQRATDAGLLMLLTCSDANSASVAPFGGLDPVFTPNPIAAGIPTSGTPVLLDISTASTTNGLSNRLHRLGHRLPAAWLMDGHGQPSDDPAVLFGQPRGSILPLGGKDSGHKGYGLSLLVESLTGALAGHGRADPPEGWGATVFLQIIDPRAFAGLDAFSRQTDHITAQCRAARPATPGLAVRLPGERGIALQQQQRLCGVALHPDILPALQGWATRFGVRPPTALRPDQSRRPDPGPV